MELQISSPMAPQYSMQKSCLSVVTLMRSCRLHKTYLLAVNRYDASDRLINYPWSNLHVFLHSLVPARVHAHNVRRP